CFSRELFDAARTRLIPYINKFGSAWPFRRIQWTESCIPIFTCSAAITPTTLSVFHYNYRCKHHHCILKPWDRRPWDHFRF
ncbi:hypothetical protein JTE90_010056, partial [Oedothorax gibbosus]